MKFDFFLSKVYTETQDSKANEEINKLYLKVLEEHLKLSKSVVDSVNLSSLEKYEIFSKNEVNKCFR